MSEAMATVTAITGSAQACDANGDLRILKANDTLLEGEIIITPNGSRVELAFADGNSLLVTDIPEMAITRDLVAGTAASPGESAVADETLQGILSALEAGEGVLTPPPLVSTDSRHSAESRKRAIPDIKWAELLNRRISSRA
jgi:hypothetical protein